MTNKTPFEILDSYGTECFHLYAVVQSLFDYPYILGDDGHDILDGKLYATAFAYLCQEYLKATIDMYPYDDWEELVHKLNFQIDEDFILEKSPIENKNQDLEEQVWGMMIIYQNKIKKDLHSVFDFNKLQGFFNSIFLMDDESSYSPTLNEETIVFLNGLISNN